MNITIETERVKHSIALPMEIIVNCEPYVMQCRKWQAVMKLIAKQNGLKLQHPKDFKAAIRIFKQSLINN